MGNILVRTLTAIVISVLAVSTGWAFAPDTYAERSVLADGRWMCVEVDKTGPVLLTTVNLREWGFRDPAKIRIYGAGGQRISDILVSENYVDDLPLLQTELTHQGIVFFAIGPEKWTKGNSGRITHSLNPFSSVARYFITETDTVTPRPFSKSGMTFTGENAATDYVETIYHELDQTSPGESGHMLLGEDLRYSGTSSFSFSLPGAVKGTKAWVQSRVVTDMTAPGQLSMTVNGKNTSPEAVMRIGATSSNTYGTLTTVAGLFDISDDKATVELSFGAEGIVSRATLDCIDLNYTRELSIPEHEYLLFSTDNSEGIISNAKNGLKLWDVTDPLDISEVSYKTDGDRVCWHSSFGPRRRYIAWNPGASFFIPAKAQKVANQNLHFTGNGNPDMVIITPKRWKHHAERIANLHRNSSHEPLQVMVAEAEQIYNEFGSGIPDVGSIRRMLKMVYDRGESAGKPLRFALLLGRATFDNRNLTQSMIALNRTTLPTWQSDESLREYDSFTSDDILAMLDDGSGSRMQSDRHSIAVGRIPAGTSEEMSSYISKLEDYVSDTGDRNGREWKNRVLVIADDGNGGRHMKQTESMIENMLSSTGGSRMFYTKAYIDAFDIIGGTCQGARDRMMHALDEGTMWWHFTGHAGRNFLTGDNMLTYRDISSLSPRKLPIFVGATCSFMRWDGTDPSGAEIMALNPNGGIIAAISATREVFIDENGRFTDAIGLEAFSTDSRGMYPTIGETFRNAKNRLSSPYGESSDNKLRYVLLGDPAMHYAMPDAMAEIRTINGVPVSTDTDSMPEIMARENVTMTGHLLSPAGDLLSDFNGTISSTLYDAEYSTTSSGRTTRLDGSGERITFEEQGERLFSGRDSVSGGKFTITIPMPSEVADNYRPAALTMYARADDGREAAGCERGFYVYGYDESAGQDIVPPSIDYAYLNHESFTEGAAVNSNPALIARISDDIGINLSTSGIGHRMTVTLDDDKVFSDVSQFYTPSIDGSPSGTLAYHLKELSPGTHSLSLKVWDTSGNSAERSISFSVDESIRPTIFNVWTDCNPASAVTNFYLSHNRPDAILSVRVAVYDLMGRMVWTSTTTDRSDMFRSAPVCWDLRDMGGRRVGRGIYVYKISATDKTSENQSPASASGKLAVSAP